MNRAILFGLVLVCFVSCANNETAKELEGTWNYDLAGTRQVMEEREAAPADINYMESIFFNLRNAQLLLKEGGEATLLLESIEQPGSWKVQNRGKELVLNLTGDEQLSVIEYLSPDTLILMPQQLEGVRFPRVLIAD